MFRYSLVASCPALRVSSLQLGDCAGYFSARLLLPGTAHVAACSGRACHFVVQLAGNVAVDSSVLVGRQVVGLPVRLQSGAHNAADVLLHLQ